MAEATGGRLIGTAAESRDYLPLLRWLILICLTAFGLVILAYFQLLQVLFHTDRTRISLLILAIFALTSLHCLYHTVAVSRELAIARRVRDIVLSATSFAVVGDTVTANGQPLEPCSLTRHIGNLVAKSAKLSRGRLDQTLLLRALADRLRAREKLGWFVAEALLRLALLGTAVGFILMLIPIAQLQSFDVETLRSALAGMSGGMAIALNVTVTGIACALLLKLQYFFLDTAIADLFNLVTEVTEVHVVSALERARDGGA